MLVQCKLKIYSFFGHENGIPSTGAGNRQQTQQKIGMGLRFEQETGMIGCLRNWK